MAFASSLCLLLLLQIPLGLGYNQTVSQGQLRGLPVFCQLCADGEVCVGYDHLWRCVGGCAQTVACDAEGCSTCGDRAEYLMNWNNPFPAGLPFDEALGTVAREFPDECGCFPSGSGLALTAAPSGSGVFCNPQLDQMCPPGDVACPQCGSDRCECPSSPAAALSLSVPGNRSLRGLSGKIYCNPGLQQMCPPGDVACPQCGSDSCECPSSPSPSPSPSGATCGRTGQVCAGGEACVGYYHSWGCVGGCAQTVACDAWKGCSTCGDRAEYLMNWNNPGSGLSFDEALSTVAREFPGECGCFPSGSGPAPTAAPSGSGVFCNPQLDQMCPPGDVACPQCGSDRCECPSSPAAALSLSVPGNRSLRGLSGKIYCNPGLQQMCPPGDVACPQCGSDSCECPSSPSPSPSPSGATCGRTGQVCAGGEACVGYYHSWGCVGGCAQTVACDAWKGCSTCGDRAEYLMNWNNPGSGLSFDEALSTVAREFPGECGCFPSGSGPAPTAAPSGSGVFCNPQLDQMCPPGDVACPQCGSDRCECP